MPKQLRTERGKGASRVGAPSPALTASASSALSSPLPHIPAQQQANMRHSALKAFTTAPQRWSLAPQCACNLMAC